VVSHCMCFALLGVFLGVLLVVVSHLSYMCCYLNEGIISSLNYEVS